MQRVQATASRARRRHALSVFVPAFGVGAVIAGVVALLLSITDRLIGLSLEWWMPLFVVAIGGAGWGMWDVLRKRLSPAAAAAVIDERLRLHDSISSAFELAEQAESNPFAAMALEQGDAAAHLANVRRAIPIPLGRDQVIWPALAGVSLALVQFAPQFDLLGSARDRDALISQTQFADDTRDALHQAGELIDQLTETDEDAPEAGTPEARARELLEELDRQLTNKQITPDEARSKASTALTEAAQRATDSADREALREEALREMIANASDASPEAGSEGNAESEGAKATDALREALAAGDFEAAAEAIDALDRLPEEQQQIAAEELEQLAEMLGRLAELEERKAQEQAQQQLEQLRDAGLDEDTAKRIAEMREREQMEETLREQGTDEETAQRIAEQAEQENRQREAKEQASEDARDIADAAEQTAEELREQQDNASEQHEGDQQQGEPEQLGAPGENGDPNVNAPTSEQSQTGENPLDNEEGGGQSTEGEPQEGAQEGEQQDGEATPGDQDGAPQEGDPGEGQQGVRQEPGDGDAQGVGTAEVDPNASDSERLGGAPDDEPGTGAGGQPKDMREMIEQMRDARERIAEERADSDELRAQAKQLLDEMSPEQREELERWAGQQLIEDGGAAAGYEYTTEAVDARTTTDGMEVRDEWFNPDGEIVRDGAVSRQEMIDSLRTAAEGAERAIEEQRVPARYRNVRRYFERALKRAEEAEEPAAPEGALEDG